MLTLMDDLHIVMREAEAGDAELFFECRSHPRTLQFVPLNNASVAGYRLAIAFGGHWVFMCGDAPAAVGTCKGLVDHWDTWEVSLYRVPTFRTAERIGASCLAHMIGTARRAERQRVIAKIHPGNVRSLEMAEACGFTRSETDERGDLVLQRWLEPFEGVAGNADQ